jgi:two-component system, cell cycle sensor histidine kinase and response regulator CckA
MRGGVGEEIYSLLVEHSLGLMCVHDLNGVLLAVNPAVTQSLGYSIEEGLGKNLKSFLAPAVQPLFDVYLERIRTTGMDSGLMRLVAKDGSERMWLYRNVRYSEPGMPPRVLGHALDITDRVAAEQALKEARRELERSRNALAERVAERTLELEQANDRLRAEIAERRRIEDELLRARYLESLGVLAGGIAHDFNNFLTIVQGNIALARTQAGDGSPMVEILDQTTLACQRAAALGRQLLAFAKGGAPMRRTMAMAPLIRDAVELARAGSAVSFEVSIAPDLWAAEVDAMQVSQAVNNLLLNARQATAAGGVVQVQAENVNVEDDHPPLPPGRYVRTAIRDFGPGIPAETLDRIFDPYFTTKKTGSGLGLTTAYAIASRHSGTITVQSELDRGSTFSMYLPASENEAAQEPPGPVAVHRGTGRILVMDDEEPIRRLLARMLSGLGYEVETAKEGAEAVRMFEDAKATGRPFAAVLVDLTVPGGMGGKQALGRLRGIDPAVKVIVSSGYSDDPVMADYRGHGFDDVVPKPWTPAQLSEVFRRVIG